MHDPTCCDCCAEPRCVMPGCRAILNAAEDRVCSDCAAVKSPPTVRRAPKEQLQRAEAREHAAHLRRLGVLPANDVQKASA